MGPKYSYFEFGPIAFLRTMNEPLYCTFLPQFLLHLIYMTYHEVFLPPGIAFELLQHSP
jgi:hypothetical protein